MSKWISTKDKLPDDNEERVLVCLHSNSYRNTKDERISFGYCSSGIFPFWTVEMFRHDGDAELRHVRSEDVIYWRHIPDLPVEEE